jgi:hypothetical protein
VWALPQPPGWVIRSSTTVCTTGADLVVGEPAGALVGHAHDDRPDPAGQVGTTGRRVVVGGVVERVDAQLDRLGLGDAVAVALLEGAAGEDAAAADAVEAALLVAAARHVVAEDAAAVAGVGASRS